MFGFEGDGDPPKGRIDGDLQDLGNMSLMEVAYSRPSAMLVCADDYYVHGIRLTLKLHPSERTDHSDMGEY